MSLLNLLSPAELFVIDTIQKEKIPVDIKKVAKSFGLKIQYSDDIQESGYIFYENLLENFIIVINNSENSTVRQRFTIAHEIAHFLLHKDAILEKGFLDRRSITGYNDRRETQANQLAADILMPRDIVYKIIKDEDINDIRTISDRFAVSTTAMAIRLGLK